MHVIQLERGYILQNSANNIPLVRKRFVIWKNILCVFLSFFSVFACDVFSSFLCSHLYTNLCSHFPVASIAAIFSFNQRQENICKIFAGILFSRDFNIPTILLEISSRLQADSVLNNALLAELSHPVMAVKLIDSDSVLITKNLLIAT